MKQLQIIDNKIYEIRDQRVMLDFDLAALYHIETRVFKQSVRRNAERFPKDFMFTLTKKEWEEVITNCDNLPEGVKYSPALPFAFTEQGVAMLSSILKSKQAIKVNIAIMRTFVALKKVAMAHEDILKNLDELRKNVSQHDAQIQGIYMAIERLLEEKKNEEVLHKREPIGFKTGRKAGNEKPK